MRKKVDQRIRTVVENGVKLHQRSMFVIVGDKGRDQVRAEILQRYSIYHHENKKRKKMNHNFLFPTGLFSLPNKISILFSL